MMENDPVSALPEDIPGCRAATHANLTTRVTYRAASRSDIDQHTCESACARAAELLGMHHARMAASLIWRRSSPPIRPTCTCAAPKNRTRSLSARLAAAHRPARRCKRCTPHRRS